MSFSTIQNAVAKQFQLMTSTGLFQAAADKETLWNTYLGSFPEGTNPIYKTRTEHDCTCCRRFIQVMGGVVSIVDGKIVTIWDVPMGGPLQAVTDAMAAYVRGLNIDNVFLHNEPIVGAANSRQLLEDKTVKTWDHFFVNLPRPLVLKGEQIGPRLSDTRATHDVMQRGLCEITLDSIDTVLELIAQNSLYRGEEHKHSLLEFRKLKLAFQKLKTAKAQDLFVWSSMGGPSSPVSRIRNTVIGTLLTDLSEGKDLEDAVKQFETKVAPTNYKRPTSLVTKAMVAKAQEKVNELGYATALERRYATIDDITINNILFADRSAKQAMNVFDEIASGAAVNLKTLDKVEEVSVEDFISKILPRAESLEVLFENKHSANLVSLIAPSDPTANQMFKWPNNFSWSYTGELTDSIKERVKAAGGCVTGEFRASLSWHNYDDLDLHLLEPNGNEIYYGNRRNYETNGELDVDMNVGAGNSRAAVENITFPSRKKMKPGVYKLYVQNFNQRETIDVGFEVELEFCGEVYSFAYHTTVKNKTNVEVAEFRIRQEGNLEMIKSLPSSQATKTVWGLPTQTFQKVNVMMVSPNYWDEKAVGNKHYFFMLDGCLNEGKARGFFNEFLNEALTPHRKVLEIVGSKMKTEESDRQLSGLGFSSTQRNHLLCRVKGAFTRVIKIAF